jgi:hypothetical protein
MRTKKYGKRKSIKGGSWFFKKSITSKLNDLLKSTETILADTKKLDDTAKSKLDIKKMNIDTMSMISKINEIRTQLGIPVNQLNELNQSVNSKLTQTPVNPLTQVTPVNPVTQVTPVTALNRAVKNGV